jgi:hypothetical protein
MKFLPTDKKALLKLALKMVDRLDTAAERKAVAEHGIAAFKDGKISITEWTSLGKKLGILTSPSIRTKRIPRIPPKSQVGIIVNEANN